MARVPSLVTTGVTYTASLSWEKKKITHSQNTWASSILKARVLWTVPRCSTSRCFKPSRSLWREKLQRQSSSTTAKPTSRWTPRRSFYNLQCPGLSPPGNPLEWDLTMLEEGECSTQGARPEAALAGIWVWRCAWGLGESCGHCWPKFWDGVSLSFSLDSFVLSDRRMSDQDMCVEKLLK